MLRYIIILLVALLFSDESKTITSREFVQNGRIDASVISDLDQNNLLLVQLDVLNDSLITSANTAVDNLELFSGPSSYHRIINSNQYQRLLESISSDYLHILDSDYEYPNTRDYWVHTIHGDDYYGSSGEVENTCMCLDASSCVVVGFNDSWYNPLDYYGEAWWNFESPDFDEIVEARVYVQGGQCDNLPIWSETDVSIRSNDCSWNGNFQATLSIDYTLNGPYVIPDDQIQNIWCGGNLQPVVGSEDNYSVDFVRMELFYSCSLPDGITAFQASDEVYCDYVELDWNLDTTSSGYYLYRDGNLVTQLSSETNYYLDYQASPNMMHEYCLNSSNNCGESESICTTGTRRGSPDSTETVYASDGSYQDYITIEWDAIDEDVLYKLYRDGAQLSVIAGNQELFYEDQFVESQVIYEYCIEAVNDCGDSAWTCDQGFVGIGNLGDINLDSQLDILDVVLLLNFILEVEVPDDSQTWLSDINSDGVLNILDIIALVNIILN